MSDFKELESIIVNQIRESIAESVKARLALGYQDSPLNRLIDKVVVARLSALEAVLSSAMDAAIKSDTFRSEINDAFNHKLARVLVSKFEGEIEKRAGELRTSPQFRAKVTLAIENAVSEASTERTPIR